MFVKICHVFSPVPVQHNQVPTVARHLFHRTLNRWASSNVIYRISYRTRHAEPLSTRRNPGFANHLTTHRPGSAHRKPHVIRSQEHYRAYTHPSTLSHAPVTGTHYVQHTWAAPDTRQYIQTRTRHLLTQTRKAS